MEKVDSMQYQMANVNTNGDTLRAFCSLQQGFPTRDTLGNNQKEILEVTKCNRNGKYL